MRRKKQRLPSKSVNGAAGALLETKAELDAWAVELGMEPLAIERPTEDQLEEFYHAIKKAGDKAYDIPGC